MRKIPCHLCCKDSETKDCKACKKDKETPMHRKLGYASPWQMFINLCKVDK